MYWGWVPTYQANVTYMLLYIFHSLSNLSDSHKIKVSIKLKITNLRIFLLLIFSSKNVGVFPVAHALSLYILLNFLRFFFRILHLYFGIFRLISVDSTFAYTLQIRQKIIKWKVSWYTQTRREFPYLL